MDINPQEYESNMKKGATRHCCYGLCKSDSRYADRDYMKGVWWITFPKQKKNPEKCQRWVRACSRENFTVDKVKKWTYICSKHFVGGNGPTDMDPDPIPANYTPEQAAKVCRKRKQPTPRAPPVSKKLKYDAAETLVSLQAVHDVKKPESPSQPCATNSLLVVVNNKPRATDVATNTESYETERNSTETQTTYACEDILSCKIATIVAKRSEIQQSQLHQNTNIMYNKFNFENISKDEKKFKFYTGLTIAQFIHLFSFLGDEVNNLIYWRGPSFTSKSKKIKLRKKKDLQSKLKLSPKDQLFVTLVKLRQALTNRDIAYRCHISVGTVSSYVNTWIQFLFRKTAVIRRKMFPSTELIKENLPARFKSFKNARIIIDCFEIFCQVPRDFGEQGNMYSHYKNHTTFKALVGIAPTGGISFISDVHEGSISDKEMTTKSGLLELLNPNDLVIADRGFDIADLLNPLKVKLNIPPFLRGREKFTPQEEILTKRIARVRIHVERAIERMKKFKIISRIVPLSLKPVISQIVHIIGFLVNYQQPLIK